MTRAMEDSAARDRRVEEAARWFMALRTTEVKSEDLKRWNEWSRVEANQQAFDSIARLWQTTNGLGEMPLPTRAELSEDDYDGSTSVSARLARENRSSLSRGAGSLFSRLRGSMKGFALAAVLAPLVVGLIIGLKEMSSGSSAADSIEVHETRASQHRNVKLADGSLVILGAKTALSVSYSPARRTVVLDRGEALFEVARDAQRPFVVVAGHGTITAVGTVFNVRRDDDRVVVSVTEGKVKVAQRPVVTPRPQKPPTEAAMLARGEQISYGAGGELGAIQRADLEATIAWRDGRLRYRSEPLKYVVMDVNRYSRKQILFGDRAAEELVFTGTVFQSQIDDWLRGLEGIFPLEIVQTDSDHVLLRTRPQP